MKLLVTTFSKLWSTVLIWIRVCLGRAWPPVLVMLIMFSILWFVPQTQEVLFSMFEPFILHKSSLTETLNQGIELFIFLCAAIVLSLTIWYNARLLCTVDQVHLMHPKMVIPRRRNAYQLAIIWVPRWLGTITLATASACLLIAGTFPGNQATQILTLCLLLQLTYAALIQLFISRRTKINLNLSPVFKIILKIFIPFACGELIILYILQPDKALITTIPSFLIASLLCFLPAIFHFTLIIRRKALHLFFPHLLRWHPASRRKLRDVLGRMLAITTVMTALLFLRAHYLQLVWLSSPIVVLLFLCVVTSTGTLATLMIGRITHWTPGIGWIAALGIAVFLATTIFEEQLGNERLNDNGSQLVASHPPSPSQLSTNILINAHGGGLRAAYFTASVLARMDELTCGTFGQHLSVASGVSGGSLGIATYLMVRDKKLRDGVWNACQLDTPFFSGAQDDIDSILLNDFLSQPLAALLSRDILPGEVKRGQILLEEWQQATTATLGSNNLSFSSPLTKLITTSNEPSNTKRLVIFNATDVATGTRFEFSTAKSNTCGDLTSIGEAVLHSARFPIISPAGKCRTTDGITHALVDGGYYDNSGAEALYLLEKMPTNPIWINIDGNPPYNKCNNSDAFNPHGMWSAASTLFSARKGHGIEAEKKMEYQVKRAEGKSIRMTLSLDEAYASTIKDTNDRCHYINQLRNAPLGWHLSYTTAHAMRISVLNEANKFCRQMSNLCTKQP